MIGADTKTVSTPSVNIPFTGISQYASDYQAILNKAIQVAQIPVTQLQTQDSTILSQKSDLGNLNSAVSALTSSLTALSQLGQGLSATSSNASAVTATNTGATTATSYTINSVTSAASAASERTTASYADSASTPVSAGTMTLVVAGQPYTLQLTSNNLNSLVDQINSSGAGVTATVINSGNGNLLSVTSGGGAEPIQLYDGASASGIDLLTSSGSGTEQSNATYADPASTQVSKGTMTLQLGSQHYTFQLASNSLTSLRDQINALGAGVTASILTTSGGNYLSVAATATGATTLALYDGSQPSGTDLLTNTNQGTNAVFQLNGINVSQSDNTVNSVIPGVTLNIVGASSSPTTISLASDPTQLSSALQNFVTQYNAVQNALQAQEGPNAGSLGGDTVISQLQTLMNQIASYTTSTGTVQSLSDLGIEFSTTGQASFDQTTFDSLSQTQLADGFQFATGGLGAFSTQMNGFSDPISGLIQAEENGLTQTDQQIQSQIQTLNDRITTLQTTLTSQMEAADAAQAELQQQQQMLSASLQGLSLVLYGKNLSQLG